MRQCTAPTAISSLHQVLFAGQNHILSPVPSEVSIGKSLRNCWGPEGVWYVDTQLIPSVSKNMRKWINWPNSNFHCSLRDTDRRWPHQGRRGPWWATLRAYKNS